MSFVGPITWERHLAGRDAAEHDDREWWSARTPSMLYFGVADEGLAAVGSAVANAIVIEPATCMWAQLTEQFDTVVIDGRSVGLAAAESCRAVLHAAVQHLCPGGRLVASFAPGDCDLVATYDQVCGEFNLEPDGREIDTNVQIAHRRTTQITIHDLVFEARSRITRIEPAVLRAALDTHDPPTVVDTRTNTDRERFGVIPRSIHIPRTVLEWACDQTNGYRHPAIVSHDQSLVLVCNGGYSSSLAASNLALLGFSAVADVIGGHQAWVRAGYDVVPPDHSSLDY